MVRECIVTPNNFIYPLFIHDEDTNTEILSMPGCQRHSLDSMMKEIEESLELGVNTFVLFPKVQDELKTNLGVEAYNPEGIVPRAIRMIKAKFPDAVVVTDVALDPYSDQGHDGIVEDGKIINDATINQLCKQVICQARAGADIVAPSDMMVRIVFWCRCVSCLFYARFFLQSFSSTIFSFKLNRTAASRPFVMLSIPKALLMFPSLPTLPSTHLPTTDPSVMPSIRTLALVTRRRTNRTLPMAARHSLRLPWMKPRVLICSWSSRACHIWMSFVV
jgi:hypothetical protein